MPWFPAPGGDGMFQGAAALNLDAKGRLAIPTRYRDDLNAAANGSVVVTAHPHRCLLIYPLSEWPRVRDRVINASGLERQAALLKRLLIGSAREEVMDGSGRILIAPELRELARLEKQVWLVGQGGHFELWCDAGWRQQQEEIFELGDKLLPPGMEDLPL